MTKPATEMTPEELQEAYKKIKEELAADKEVQKMTRDRLKTLLQRTPTCSGNNRIELRSFIESFDAAKLYSNATDTEIIPQLISLCVDPLRSAIDQFIKEFSTPAVTWEDIRTFIIEKYLE